MTEWTDLIKKRLRESIHVKEGLLQGEQVNMMTAIGEAMVDAYRKGNKIILFGNGGSAADAQHIAAELVGKYYFDRDPLPAIALTVNTSSLTAISNDYSYDKVFSRQLAAFGNAGDIAVGISTSGNSENVLQALNVAKEKGLTTVGFTGEDGGKLKGTVDFCLRIPGNDTPRIQEGHITVGHILCEIVEMSLFGTHENKSS